MMTSTSIDFRTTERGDGSRLWRLVRATEELELNSAYFYLTFAEYFGETCLLAEHRGKPIGCVIAFRPPRHEDALFIWQICVLPEARGMGLGSGMIRRLLLTPACRDIRYLLATVTPDNTASRRMFERLAGDFQVTCTYSSYYTADLFPVPHAEEKLFRIGPLPEREPVVKSGGNPRPVICDRQQ